MTSDQELLRSYLEEGSDDAFAELVHRHLALVYSVARRVVRSPQRAEDVTQSVFVALAQNARRIKPGTPLAAWLHLVSRRMAIDFVRRENRRQQREQHATEIATMTTKDPEWSAIEPLLDEAVESLGALDRAALLLRYFENKSLRQVGEILGISEDNAQKRVSRTLERLRKYFTSRGITVTASGLVTGLSAHAIESAPLTLGATLPGAVLAAAALAPPATLPSLIFSFAMTSTQKTLFALGLAAMIAGGLYEFSVIVQQRHELRAARDHRAQLLAQNKALRQHIADAKSRLLAPVPSPAPVDPERQAAEAMLETWINRLLQFKRRVAEMKDRQIPEMQYLTENDWMEALYNADVSTDLGVRKALSTLRQRAKGYFIQKLRGALMSYIKANNGQLPTGTAQLAPYFSAPIDPAILPRYEIAAANADNSPFKNMPIREKAPVDDYYDTMVVAGPQGTGMQSMSLKGKAINEALKEYRALHPGATPTAAEIAPYLKTDVDPAYLKEILDGHAGR